MRAQLDSLAARYHHHGLAVQHALAVDGGLHGEDSPSLLRVEARDLARRHHLIADMHRRAEFEALAEIDAARPGQLGAEHGGEQTRGEKAMSNALLEHSAGGIGV